MQNALRPGYAAAAPHTGDNTPRGPPRGGTFAPRPPPKVVDLADRAPPDTTRESKRGFSTLRCKGAESNECLTQPQLNAVEMFYGGLKNKKGEVIFAGQALGNPVTPMRSNQNIATITDTVRIWAFQNPNYDWRSFDLDR